MAIVPKPKCKLTSLLCLQELPEADATAERYPHPAAELCRLPQAQELAVVATLHQSQASPAGQLASYLFWPILLRAGHKIFNSLLVTVTINVHVSEK
jgi:hypothetical protein